MLIISTDDGTTAAYVADIIIVHEQWKDGDCFVKLSVRFIDSKTACFDVVGVVASG